MKHDFFSQLAKRCIASAVILLAMLSLAIAASGESTSSHPPRDVAVNLGPCTTAKLKTVTNGLSASDCAGVGGGTTEVLCLCLNGSWSAVVGDAPAVGSVSDLGTCSSPSLKYVDDGNSSSDCTTGDGSNDVLCACRDGVWSEVSTVPEQTLTAAYPLVITGSEIAIADPYSSVVVSGRPSGSVTHFFGTLSFFPTADLSTVIRVGDLDQAYTPLNTSATLTAGTDGAPKMNLIWLEYDEVADGSRIRSGTSSPDVLELSEGFVDDSVTTMLFFAAAASASANGASLTDVWPVYPVAEGSVALSASAYLSEDGGAVAAAHHFELTTAVTTNPSALDALSANIAWGEVFANERKIAGDSGYLVGEDSDSQDFVIANGSSSGTTVGVDDLDEIALSDGTAAFSSSSNGCVSLVFWVAPNLGGASSRAYVNVPSEMSSDCTAEIAAPSDLSVYSTRPVNLKNASLLWRIVVENNDAASGTLEVVHTEDLRGRTAESIRRSLWAPQDASSTTVDPAVASSDNVQDALTAIDSTLSSHTHPQASESSLGLVRLAADLEVNALEPLKSSDPRVPRTGSSPPSSPVNGSVWLNTDAPANVCVWTGSYWEPIFPDNADCYQGTTGLVAHYEFDEGSGTVVGDSVASADGSTVGTVTWSSGGLELDGSTGYVDLGQALSGSTDVSTSFTLAVCAQVDDPDGTLIGRRDGSTIQWQLYVTTTSSNALCMRAATESTWPSNVLCASGATSGLIGERALYSVTVNADGDTSLYSNGALFGSRDDGDFRHSDVETLIGARFDTDPATTFHLDGTVYDVRVYSREIGAAEMRQLSTICTN